MYKLESLAITVAVRSCTALRRRERSAIVTLRLEDFAQHFA